MKTKGGREWVVDRGQRLEASYAKTHRVGDEGRDETGHHQRNLELDITACVTICQVGN
jgi:hypothetical protein